MFLFSYYKTKVLICLPCLFHIYKLKRTTHSDCDTVNCEYTVRNRKYAHPPYQHLLVYVICYYEYKTHSYPYVNANI
jgi:hypothetical protein